jgi:putative membrane protein
MIRQFRLSRYAASSLLLLLAGCGGSDDASNDTTPSATATPSTAGGDSAANDSAAGGSNMSAANVASVVAMLNASEIAEGQTAVRKARDSGVKQFGQTMIDDHLKLQKKVDSVALAKNITPQAPPQAAEMEQKTSALEDSLKALTGAAFDRAYINAQVAGHQEAIRKLNAWSSAVQDADFAAALRNAIPTIQDHLDKAKALQSKLGGATGRD